MFPTYSATVIESKPCASFISLVPSRFCYTSEETIVVDALYKVSDTPGEITITGVCISNYASGTALYNQALIDAATVGYMDFEDGITIESTDSIIVTNEYNDPGRYYVEVDGTDFILKITE